MGHCYVHFAFVFTLNVTPPMVVLRTSSSSSSYHFTARCRTKLFKTIVIIRFVDAHTDRYVRTHVRTLCRERA